MLSDACSDFVTLYARQKDAARLVAELREDVAWYSRPNYPLQYPADPGSQVDALRRAIKRVLARPEDQDAMLWLLMLAECVRHYFDFYGGDANNDLDVWCVRQLRELENLKNGRCPHCGQNVEHGYMSKADAASMSALGE